MTKEQRENRFQVSFYGRRKNDAKPELKLPPMRRWPVHVDISIALLIVMAAAFLFILSGCTKPEATKRILEREGYQEISITGYRWFSCSDDDFWQTGFVAKKNGQIVRGTVCAGLLFKGSTVRFDE